MPYSYNSERPKIFTEQGQVDFLKVRDMARQMIREAGAFRYNELIDRCCLSGDSWFHMACVERLVELGEIQCLKRDWCWSQYQVYTDMRTGS